MAPPINVQDWYGDRHTCQIASGALVCSDVVGRWSFVVGCHARALWPNGAS